MPSPSLTLRVELWEPYFGLGAALIAKNKFADGLEILLKGLEALGFDIVACPPRDAGDDKDKTKAVLKIKRWGQVNEYTWLGAFRQMMYSYKQLAPELYEVARRYAYVAYSM